MTYSNLNIPILVVATVAGNHQLLAQDFGLEYETEWQTNFRGDCKWVDLLKASASVPLSGSVTLQGSTISVARTSDEPLADDMQGYSNIEESNLPLALSVLGAEFNVARSTMFVGIRNVNEDYFTTPVTSFFINSSCGIFPTISGNYAIANYPLSGWCLHYGYSLDRFDISASLYQGLGHRRFTGHDNVFTFDPADEGLFAITSADYIYNDNNLTLGCAVYYGVCDSDDDGVEATALQASSRTTKKVSVAPWVNLEHALSHNCNIMLQGSYATRGECRYYLGAGTTYTAGSVKLGLFADYAGYTDVDEIATELTCALPLSERVSLRPTLQLISTDRKLHTIGLLRLTCTL